ncbi:unnamed protein product [Caenorhabditis angaria]|uniref:Uncharacterized protein n=1 Tax=Caenorhabditis angaria TaxID=860376 RepID=A0A9P1I5E1_9PELO|nr:unnamed protein product [Caenorhabditis angaria]
MADIENGSSTYYDQILENPYVKTAINVYSSAKEVHPIINSTLTTAENNVAAVSNYATQKAVEGYNSYYVKPKNTAYEAYNYGSEKAYNAVETGKNAAIVGGTFGIGAAVVLTQFSLALSAGGAALVLDQVDSAKQLGSSAISTLKDAELAIEHKIVSAVQQAQRIAMVPVEKISENTMSLLDILDAAVERALALQVTNPADATISQRISNLAGVIVKGLSNKAHNHVIDPLNGQVRVLLEQLSRSFVLVDVMRSKQVWVKEKVEELSASVSDLKKQFENEAAQYKVAPEEVLMRSIRNTSSQLGARLKSLREKGQNVFGDGTRIDSAIDYLENLESSLGDAQDVYKVRDEVICEARQRIAELTTWTTSLLVRQQTSPSDAPETPSQQ